MRSNTFNFKINKNVFITTLSMLLLYVLPIMGSNRYYIDDIGRALDGYTDWGYNGRPLVDILMSALSFGFPLVDISPLTQIMAIALLGYILSMYASKYFSSRHYLTVGVTVSLLAMTPFMLENWSYRYDSLPMIMSVALCVFAYCNTKDNIFSFISSIVLLVSSLSLYQASISSFIILCIIDVIAKMDSRNTSIIIGIINRVVQLLIAYLVYQHFIAKYTVIGSYNLSHSEIIDLSTNSINALKHNVNVFIGFISLYINSMPFLMKIFYGIAFISSIIILLIREARSEVNSVIKCIVIILSPVLVFYFVFLHLSILKQPVFASRVLISSGTAFLYFAIVITLALKDKVALFVLLPVVIFSYVGVYSFSNAVDAQRKTDELISSSIYNDISHSGKSFKSVSFAGTMPQAKQKEILTQRFPAISRIIPIYMNGDWVLGTRLLELHRVSLTQVSMTHDSFEFINNNKPFIESTDYSLFDYNGKLIVKF